MAIGGARSRPSPAGWYERPAEPCPLPGPGPVTAPALQGPELGPGGLWGERLVGGCLVPSPALPFLAGGLGSCIFICHGDVGVRAQRAPCDLSAPSHVSRTCSCHFLPQVKPPAGHGSLQRGGGPPGRGRWADDLSAPAGPGRPLGTSRCQRPRPGEAAGSRAPALRGLRAGGLARLSLLCLVPSTPTPRYGPSVRFPGRRESGPWGSGGGPMGVRRGAH